jgi:hypothetical protein
MVAAATRSATMVATLGQFEGEFGSVVGLDFARQHLGADQHRAALVPLLEDVDADLLRQADEPGRQWAAEEERSGQSHDHATDEFGPGLGDIGIGRHIADGHRYDAVVRQRQIDAVAEVEIDEVPEVSEEPHLDELHLMLSHQEGQKDRQQQAEAEQGRQHRPAQAFHHHHVAQANELRSTGEGSDVADDLAARRFMLDRDGRRSKRMSPSRGMVFLRVFDGEVEKAIGILGCGLLDQRVERQTAEFQDGHQSREIEPVTALSEGQGDVDEVAIVSENDVPCFSARA